jgi:hypothetical protein
MTLSYPTCSYAMAGNTRTPRGHTPVICHHFKWKRASMAAGLCYGSRGGGAQVAFHQAELARSPGLKTWAHLRF